MHVNKIKYFCIQKFSLSHINWVFDRKNGLLTCVPHKLTDDQRLLQIQHYKDGIKKFKKSISLKYVIVTDYKTWYFQYDLLGCFKSFVRYYESTLNCNISVNTYLFHLIEISAIRISAFLPT